MAMADGYGLFWNSDSGDRKYDAKSFEKWLKKFFTSGVFEGDLQVLASSGMTVQVQTGYSNLNGKVGLFESATDVTLSAANSRYPRIDTIIIERNDVDRVIQIDKVTGAYTGENPHPTAPIWDETQGIYQLVLAQIYVGAGVSSISQEDITDKRTDTDVCGYIAGTVNEMDFSQFTAQFEAYFSTFEATQLAKFEEWFDHMKDQLDSDAAGHLQAEVDDINTALNGKAPTNHASANDTYGKGSTVNYGHNKVIDDLSKTSYADGESLSARQGNMLGKLVAPIETDLSSASQDYTKGDQFIYNGLLYKATAAITQGGTITINGNCTLSDSVVKQIYDLDEKRYLVYKTGISVNTLTEAGEYQCADCSNTPPIASSLTWNITVQSYKSGSAYVKQIARTGDSAGQSLYVFERTYIPSRNQWTGWANLKPYITEISANLHSGKTYVKFGSGYYGVFIIHGTMGGIGAIALVISITSGNIGTIRDLLTGNVWSNTNLTFAYAINSTDGNGYLTITTTSTLMSNFTMQSS